MELIFLTLFETTKFSINDFIDLSLVRYFFSQLSKFKKFLEKFLAYFKNSELPIVVNF